MFLRIVRMDFRPEAEAQFTEVFNRSKHLIRQFPGCERLELHRDLEKPTVFYTYSFWRSPEDLENYRNSQLFADTWAATKVLFQDKPYAFSLVKVETIELETVLHG